MYYGQILRLGVTAAPHRPDLLWSSNRLKLFLGQVYQMQNFILNGILFNTFDSRMFGTVCCD